MIVTIPSFIAAGIATAVVTGGITGTALYLMSGNANVLTVDQVLHILKLGHMEPWVIAMMCATVLIGMGTCGACCHKRGKSYVTDKEAKLRDCALGRAKELVHMGAHGADKLLQDVQTYHDMHHEIVTQKMHQITTPSNIGRYRERPCKNPQCQECPKPRHMTIGFSSSRQEATLLSDPLRLALLRASRQTDSSSRQTDQQIEERSSSPLPPASNSSSRQTNQQIEERSSLPPAADSSPPRQIAAVTPPKVVTAPSDLFHSNKLANIFISPHIPKPKKWDPITNGKLHMPVDNVDFTSLGLTKLLKRQGQQNNKAMFNLHASPARKQTREELLARQGEQKDRQAFSLLPGQEKKHKLRRPRVHVSVPMGLPSTSEDWNEKDSDEWCRTHVPDWHSGRKIIDANSHHLVMTATNDDDKMTSYANEEGKQLYRVPQRRIKSDDTYAREDLDLAASLRRNAAATAAAAPASAPAEPANWD
jgi:hypothetical protein